MRIDEVQLLTSDLTTQREFYGSVLGLPVVEAGDDALAIDAGNSRLAFTQAPEGWSGFYHFAFNIPEDQLAEAKEWTSRRVPLIRSNSGEDEFFFDTWNAHSFYFYDPSGNILEFIARHNLPEQSSRPFTERNILNISEIGIASDDVLATVASAQAGLDVDVYYGPPSDTFTAVGDDHGLLIIVKRGRIWFPDTGKAADMWPVRAAVSVNGRRYELSGPPYRIATVAP